MISNEKMSKLVGAFSAPISRATYELNGVETETAYTLKAEGFNLRILMILDNAITGQAGNFKVFDSDGSLVCMSNMSFFKVSGKKQYLSFEIKFTERMN